MHKTYLVKPFQVSFISKKNIGFQTVLIVRVDTSTNITVCWRKNACRQHVVISITQNLASNVLHDLHHLLTQNNRWIRKQSNIFTVHFL